MKRMSIYIIILLLLFGVGCATATKSTQPTLKEDVFTATYTPDQIKEIKEDFKSDEAGFSQQYGKLILWQMYQKNSLLAKELVTLPEFLDGISPLETKALENIMKLYDLDKDTFDKVFQQMYQMGIPEVREYCSLLQGLFWIAEKDDFGENNNPISNDISDNMYLKLFLKKAWGDMEGPKWKDFKEVTSRLNSPELINHYTRNFTYQQYIGDRGGARSAFKRGGGNCVDIEDFQRFCLKKAGYKANKVIVMSKATWCKWHDITKFYVDGKMYIMDNGKPVARGIRGPYKSISESGYTLKH